MKCGIPVDELACLSTFPVDGAVLDFLLRRDRSPDDSAKREH